MNVKKQRTALAEKLEAMDYADLLFLRAQASWRRKARPKQIPPNDLSWNFFGVKSGRGFGKTLAAANWAFEQAWTHPGSIGHVVAPTHDDVRYTCFEGPTGLYSIIPQELIAKEDRSLPSITLINGSTIRGFAADTPERLRGPQCHWAWCDEIASWRYPKEAWSNLTFGLRLGPFPQLFWTGTPKPTAFMRELVKMKGLKLVEGSTYENKDNLPTVFFENIAKYEGTALGRQELYGEILDPEEAGYVKRSQLQLWPHDKPLPKFKLVVLSLDTAFTEKTFDKKETKSDPTACSVWGVFDWKNELHAMLVDAWQDHLGFPALISKVRKEKDYTYGEPDAPVLRGPRLLKAIGRKPDILLVEDKGSGISLRQSLAAENILVTPYNPGSADKLARLHISSPMFAHKRVWVIESEKNPGQPKSWAEDLITQVCSFVGAGSIEHDDLLDTTTQALKYIMDAFAIRFTVSKKKEPMPSPIKKPSTDNPYFQ